MKVFAVFASAVLLSFSLTGCAPDLTVRVLNTAWNETTKSATATIENIGSRDAGIFMVYFDGEENPVSSNHRPQVRLNVPGLAKGVSVALTADFAPLAHPDNANLGNVYKIKVMADPKNMVEESNETNNTMEKQVP
jgi:subtilase family serine protease